MDTRHIIINGDSRVMKEIDDKSIHLIVTSPPYWQLKDYDNENQIGFNDNYENYINNLNLVWNECYRVLHDGCRLCVNIGDQFARAVYYGRYKVIPIRTEIIKFCEEIGFDYMGAIIWQKVTTTNTTGGASIMGSFPYPRNGILKIDYEFILIFKKPGEGPKVSQEIKEDSKIDKDEWNKLFQGHWNFPGGKQTNHIASFPEELPKRLIKMFTFVGETVLDPFLGSGTTSLAALKLNRNSIGYEINPNYIEVIKERLYPSEMGIFDKPKIVYKKQILKDFFPEQKIKSLKYIFKDPHSFDKKIDPRNITFGNKITGNENEKDQSCTIKEILSVDTIKLEGGTIIKLIGIKPSLNNNEGIEYLTSLIKGNKIYLQFDNNKYDEFGNLLCYVYLSNKTFINTNLLSKGYADVDETAIHSKSKLFNKYKRVQ